MSAGGSIVVVPVFYVAGRRSFDICCTSLPVCLGIRVLFAGPETAIRTKLSNQYSVRVQFSQCRAGSQYKLSGFQTCHVPPLQTVYSCVTDMNRKGIVVPSAASVEQSRIMQNMTESQVADDYLRHPPLPVDQEVVIDKLAILNFDLLTKQPMGMLRYGALRIKRPDMFPECTDPELEYQDEEQVSPVIVISGDKKYTTDQMIWFPLSDAIRDIMIRQGRTGTKLLPVKVRIDKGNQWIATLMNLARGFRPPQ